MAVPDSEKSEPFIRLYVENEEALRGFVRSHFPTLEDVREVMQDLATVLWRLDSPGNFRQWAFGVAQFGELKDCRWVDSDTRIETRDERRETRSGSDDGSK